MIRDFRTHRGTDLPATRVTVAKYYIKAATYITNRYSDPMFHCALIRHPDPMRCSIMANRYPDPILHCVTRTWDSKAPKQPNRYFTSAANYINSLPPSALLSKIKLRLYGLHKAGAIGRCQGKRPRFYRVVMHRQKWDAWAAASAKYTPEQAKQAYINAVNCISEEFKNQGKPVSSVRSSTGDSALLSVSTLQIWNPDQDEGIAEKVSLSPSPEPRSTDDSLIGIVKTMDTQRLRNFLRVALAAGNLSDELANCDYQGATALHWAADRGDRETVKLLLDYGAAPQAVDIEGQSPLHYAVCGGHYDAGRIIAKAEPQLLDIADADGITPKLTIMEAGQFSSIDDFMSRQ